MLNSAKILGVNITTNSEEEILKYILSELEKPRSKRNKIIIFTPNPEQITAASKSSELKDILNQADIALPDGVGVVIGGKLVGVGSLRRITGVDFMKSLVKTVSNRPIKTGYFGGQEGVAEEAANCLQKSYPNLTVGYASSTYNKEKMMSSDIDVLFVGLGFPKQEKWILENKDEIPASVIMAVGGSFDFLSGRVARAPKVIQTFGLEWVFRLVRQPWRAKRQARLLGFGGLILKEALSSKLNKSKKK
jgi:N-acetylglucosaminyldiphosphoundecaprenol N-acetyl-beta-D-mannosaminyltransferase